MKRIGALVILGLVLCGALVVRAQGGLPPTAAEQCAPILAHLWTTASAACINKPAGYACNGGASPGVEPASVLGSTFAPIGSLVDVAQIDAIDLPPIQTENVALGLTWMRLPDASNASLLLIGDVTLYDVTPQGFAPWTNALMQTSSAPPTCPAAPYSVVIVQTPIGRQANLVFNGISLALIGTALVRTTDTATQFSMISGLATVFAQGGRQQIVAGQQTSVPYGTASFAQPGGVPTTPTLLDPAPLRNLPVALFDRPLLLPQPGFLSTGGSINLRTDPDVFAAVLRELAPGEVLTLLGSNPGGDWYHVQLDTGTTGWVYAPLLVRNVGEIAAIYEATPLPPQRLGELGTRGRVRSPDGANLRRGPDTSFTAIARVGTGTLVDLVGRSPYGNGWLKVNAGGTVGWMSPFTIDTLAFLEALPIDWNAPAYPTPTPVPGSFGNAFPDPVAPDDEG
ncbi:MAG: SH3 domain-containing protein [Chloroflexota bacterium]|nr:SH3 domain-containing protein [Chloroflexota bacterium]